MRIILSRRWLTTHKWHLVRGSSLPRSRVLVCICRRAPDASVRQTVSLRPRPARAAGHLLGDRNHSRFNSILLASSARHCCARHVFFWLPPELRLQIFSPEQRMAAEVSSEMTTPPLDDPKAVAEHDTLKYHLLGPSLTKAGQDSVDQSKVLHRDLLILRRTSLIVGFPGI